MPGGTMLTTQQIRVLNEARTILKNIHAPLTHSGGYVDARAQNAENAVFSVLNALNAYGVQEIPDRLLFNKETGDEPRHLGRADSVKIESDEDGFELHITTDQGTFTTIVHGVMDDITACGEVIDAYWGEGAQMAREYEAEHGAIDRDAYDRTDPKHPDYHATMSALADDLR